MDRKEVCILFLIIFAIVLGCFAANTGQDMNFYHVQIGNEEIAYQVIEDTSRLYIEDVFESHIHEEGYWQVPFKEVFLKDVRLKVEKYDCYEESLQKKLNCKTFYTLAKKPPLKLVEEVPSSLVIMKDEKTIYDSVYVEDIHSFIQEKGRYYFIVTYKTHSFKSVKETKLLFTVKVV